MAPLSDFDEDAVLARLLPLLDSGENVLVGPGDDCAVVGSGKGGMLELLKTDCVVEGIHFTRETAPSRVGHKVVARTLSDFAAMGGQPGHLLVTVATPSDRDLRWLQHLYRGMNKCARAHRTAIVGGETSSLPSSAPVMISVAGTGRVTRRQLVTRSGGRAGDLLFVTGRLGRSLRGHHLTFTPRLVEADWLTKKFSIHAMIDLSDGLARDLPRLAAASGCGLLLDHDAIPRTRGASPEQALRDGEDYELLFALSPRSAARLQREWNLRFPGVKLSRIGSLTDSPGDTLEGGWDHFAR